MSKQNLVYAKPSFGCALAHNVPAGCEPAAGRFPAEARMRRSRSPSCYMMCQPGVDVGFLHDQRVMRNLNSRPDMCTYVIVAK